MYPLQQVALLSVKCPVTIQMDKALPYCMVNKGGALADSVFDSNSGLFTESLRFLFSPFLLTLQVPLSR